MKKKRIYATKRWLIKKAGEDAARSYQDATRVQNAMGSMIHAFCESALASHLSAGQWYCTTSDGMEWSVQFDQIGKKKKPNAKTR